MSDLKKEVRIGEIRLINANEVWVNTLGDQIIKLSYKDRDEAWSWYCKPVKITIEEISGEEITAAVKKHNHDH